MSIYQHLDGLGVFKAYIAIKQHFNPKTKYNIFVKGINIRGTRDQFNERVDKSFFNAIALKYPKGDVMLYLMSNITKGNNHPATMTDSCLTEYKYKMKNLGYIFNQDLIYLSKFNVELKYLFLTKTTALPISLQALNGGKIELETICVINKISKNKILDTFDKQIKNFVYPKIRNMIIQYENFIRADFKKLNKILNKYIG